MLFSGKPWASWVGVPQEVLRRADPSLVPVPSSECLSCWSHLGGVEWGWLCFLRPTQLKSCGDEAGGMWQTVSEVPSSLCSRCQLWEKVLQGVPRWASFPELGQGLPKPHFLLGPPLVPPPSCSSQLGPGPPCHPRVASQQNSFCEAGVVGGTWQSVSCPCGPGLLGQRR